MQWGPDGFRSGRAGPSRGLKANSGGDERPWRERGGEEDMENKPPGGMMMTPSEWDGGWTFGSEHGLSPRLWQGLERRESRTIDHGDEPSCFRLLQFLSNDGSRHESVA